MKRSRTYAFVSLLAAGTMFLSACSDNTSDSGSDNGGDDKSAVKIDCGTGQLNSSGSSAQLKAIDAWQSSFASECPDMTVNYDGSGSGQGIKDFLAAKTTMAGSDSALKEEEAKEAMARCDGYNAINIPMVISPVGIVYNVNGVDKLNLNAEVIAEIFGGTITTWNDPKIAELNKDAKLPATTITTVHRSKDSGTTDNFTKYLEAASNGKWTFGTGKSWNAPGGQGAPDSAGIVSVVKSTDGSISYVDGPDAKANSLKTAAIDSGFGPVEMNKDGVGKAVAAAEHAGQGNDLKLKIDYGLKEEGAYPLVLVAYEITCEKGLKPEEVKNVKAFLTYAANQGQDMLSDIGFSPLPEELQKDVQKAIEAIS